MTETLLGFAAFLILAFLRVPMAFAMGIVGFAGVAYKLNVNVAAAMIAQVTYETGLSYTLSVIPLFILMGNFVVRARMSDELYHAAYCFLGHRRGGLAMSTIVACAGLGVFVMNLRSLLAEVRLVRATSPARVAEEEAQWLAVHAPPVNEPRSPWDEGA